MKKLRLAAVPALLLLSILTKVYVEGAIEWRGAQKAEESGDFAQAIVHYQRSIQWYLPFLPRVERAAERLFSLGEARERAGDREGALAAYRVLRSGAYSIRWLVSPLQSWADRADERIIPLMAADPVKAAGSRVISPDEIKKELRAFQRAPRAPSPFWSTILILGLLLWTVTAGAFLFYGFTADGRFLLKASAPWIIGAVIGYLFWILGMLRA